MADGDDGMGERHDSASVPRPGVQLGLSIRIQMLGVALAVMLPMLLLALYQIREEAVQARGNVEQIALTIARINAAEVSRILSITESFLEAAAKDPDIQALDRSQCGTRFVNFPKIYPHHTNLLTKDIEGFPICSALPIPSGAKVNLLYYLDEVRHANGFAIGTPNQGPLSKRWVVPLDFPLRNRAGEIVGTVSAPLDLLNFNPFVGTVAFEGLPDGTTATLFAPDMTLLARSLEPEKWVGSKRVVVPQLVNLVARRSGTTRFVSKIDDVERIHGAAPVPGTAWTSIASIPTAPLDTRVNAVIRTWMGITLVAVLVSLGLAYALSRWLAGPILAVARIARKVEAGDTEVRAVAVGSREIQLFAQAFNSMLDSLHQQQRQLAGSEERYHSLFSGAKIAELLVDPRTGDIIDANDAACRYYGYDLDRIRSLRIQDINCLAPDQVAQKMVGAATEADGHLYFRHRLADGTIRDVEVHSGPIKIGGRTLLYSVVHDVTDRKRLETERQLLVMAIEQCPVSIIVADPSGAIEYVNPTFLKTTGYDRDEVLGQNPRLLKSGFTPENEYREMWNRLCTGEIWTGMFQNRRKDGSTYWEQAQISPVMDGDGTITHFVGVKTDITERREAEETIRTLVLRLQSVLDAASEVAIIATDMNGLITVFNRGAERMLGYQATEIIGLATPELFHLADEVTARALQLSEEIGHDVSGFKAFVAKAEMLGQDRSEWTYIRKDAERITVSLAVTTIPDQDGKISGYLGVAVDISDRKRAEAEIVAKTETLTEQAAQLARSNAELEQFAYVASHDLRQPLRMISSYLRLMEKRLGAEITGELREYLDYAVNGAKRMDQLIVDLLEYSRIGKHANGVDDVDLRAAINGVLFNMAPAIEDTKATVLVAGTFPVVRGNRIELERLFQNLIGNALKYQSPHAQPNIEIGGRKDSGEWRFWVKDNGIGIAPADHERIFAIFQRLVGMDEYEGTGIGLSVCKKIVEHHGGRIWVDSTPGVGSTFYFTLPTLTTSSLSPHDR